MRTVAVDSEMLLPAVDCDDGFVSDAMEDASLVSSSSIGLAACPSPVPTNYLELRSLYQTPCESEAEGSIAGSRPNVIASRKELLLNPNAKSSFYHRANVAKAHRLTRRSSLNCSRDEDFEEYGLGSLLPNRSVASVPTSLSCMTGGPRKASPENCSELSASDVEDVIGVLTRTLTRAEKRGMIVTANSKSLPCSPPMVRAKVDNGGGLCRVVGIKRSSNVVVDDPSLMDITNESVKKDVRAKQCNGAQKEQKQCNGVQKEPVVVQRPPLCKNPSVDSAKPPENGIRKLNGSSSRVNGEKTVAFHHRRASKSLDRLEAKQPPVHVSGAQRRARSAQRQDSSSSPEPKRRQEEVSGSSPTSSNRPNTLKISFVPLKENSSEKLTPKRESPSSRVVPQQVNGSAGIRKRIQREINEVLNSGGIGLHHHIKRPHELVIQVFESAVCLFLGEDHLVSARNHGNMTDCLNKLASIDNSLVMGHVLRNMTTLMEGRGVSRQALQTMMDICQAQRSDTITQLHVKATLLASQGYMDRAVNMWEEIIDKQPLNILAIKFAHDGYVRLGMFNEMLALTSKGINQWKPVMPFYGQILNLHSLSLVENGKQEEAESFAKQSHSLDGTSLKAIHSLVQVNYMRHDYDAGIQLLLNTKSLWIDSERLASHYLWHLALFHMKRRDYNTALDLWDTELKPRAIAADEQYILPLLDAASMLMRLSMQGMLLQQRWRDLYRVLSRHLSDHVWIMNDLHILMAALGTHDTELVRSFKDSIQIFIQNGKGTNHKVTKEVGLTLCEAMVSHGAANHERVVDLMYPIRGQIFRIGGTQAQRDIFHEILISSAGKSRMPSHQKLVRQLSEEKRVP